MVLDRMKIVLLIVSLFTFFACGEDDTEMKDASSHETSIDVGNGDVAKDAPYDPCKGKMCVEHAFCQEVFGEGLCICDKGYRGDPPGFEYDVGKCVVDECLTDNGGCDENANCSHDEYGDVMCLCKEGYSGDGKTCTKDS